MEHTEDPSVLWDIAEDLDKDGLCAKCESGHHCLLDCDDCREIVEERLNEHMYEVAPEHIAGICEKEHSAWMKLICQAPDGHFAKYDKVSWSLVATIKPS